MKNIFLPCRNLGDTTLTQDQICNTEVTEFDLYFDFIVIWYVCIEKGKISLCINSICKEKKFDST